MVVSPDTGGVERARAFAKRLRVPLAIIDKRREDADVVEMFNVIGEVEGKTCLIVDDMIGTGGTLAKGAKALKAKGREQGSGLLHPRGFCRKRHPQYQGFAAGTGGGDQFDSAAA